MEEKIETTGLLSLPPAYTEFSNIIKTISEDKRLKPDLMKCENGANFRAVSESAILDAISPVLSEKGIYYTVSVKESHLDIKEMATAKGVKYVFVATVTLMVNFFDFRGLHLAHTESVGMGIDDGDKAMGKAYTYAVKYALLKVFRLRYGDDPDHDASKPIIKAPAAEPAQASKKPAAKEDKKPARAKGSAKKPASLMTEKQRDYILGLMDEKKVDADRIIEEFGVDPTNDKAIPMDVAQRIISWFREDGYLPF